MAPEAAKSSSSSSCSPKKSLLMAQIMLRVLAAAFSLASISVMITSSQTVQVFGILFKATYSYSSAWRFLLGANIATCILSALSLMFVSIVSCLTSLRRYFLLFVLDMVTMLLLISGCAAATAIGYVSKHGELKMGWGAICDNVSKFCNRSTISLVLSYLAFFCYLGLTTMSAHRLMSQATE